MIYTHRQCVSFFFFFNDTATTEIYTLSLHDALPISIVQRPTTDHQAVRTALDNLVADGGTATGEAIDAALNSLDRKSTRLNSSHANISYAVFCLKKKKNFIQSSSLTS